MAGIDRHTGKVMPNYDHALQSVEVVLSTRIGTRVMRRQFCGGAAELLGRAVTPPLFTLFQQLVATAIDIWEPRFRVRQITPQGTVEQIRAGQVGVRFEVDYRPRAHLGDFTVERVLSFGLNFRAGGLRVVA